MSINVKSNVKSSFVLEYKQKWDSFVAERNYKATLTANRAWHVSSLWVRAQAQEALVSSTANTILLECAVGFAGILMFTGDPVLAVLVLALIIANISGLAFFMISVMGWLIGPIEIIFLVVFLGYSVTFGLHMANSYNQARTSCAEVLKFEAISRRPRARQRSAEPVLLAELPHLDSAAERRRARTRMAVIHVGGAILSATVSTIGSSIFLLFCSLVLFIRLGCVIICVTCLSLVSTLLVLPAVLLLLGPSEKPCYKRIPFKAYQAAIQWAGSFRSSRQGNGLQPPLLKSE